MRQNAATRLSGSGELGLCYRAGHSVLAHGAAGAVGSMVTQLAREAGAYVIGTGRAADRSRRWASGRRSSSTLENDTLKDVGSVDLVFDVIGGDIAKRSAGLMCGTSIV